MMRAILICYLILFVLDFKVFFSLSNFFISNDYFLMIFNVCN